MQPFSYSRAASLEDAVRAIGTDSSVHVLAGGTTLYDLMKLNVERPATIMDINHLSGLDMIEVGEEELVVGALARMSDVADHEQIKSDYPLLSESLWKAASQQLRNLASVGGNLLQRTRCGYFRSASYPCNKRQPGSGCPAIGGLDRALAILGTSDACIANYPGDWAVALVAMNASVDLLGPSGERTLSVEELHVEPGRTPQVETSLRSGELITRIRVPAGRIGRSSTYHKVRDRESYAFALVSAAVALDLAGDVVREARIAVGGVATRPWRARAAEAELEGQRLTPDSAMAAGRAALAGARPGTQNGFKVELGARTVAEALMIAQERG